MQSHLSDDGITLANTILLIYESELSDQSSSSLSLFFTTANATLYTRLHVAHEYLLIVTTLRVSARDPASPFLSANAVTRLLLVLSSPQLAGSSIECFSYPFNWRI